MGDGVNITAQLEGIAKPDAICLAVSEPRRADDKNKQMGWGSQTRLI
jgi:class 3 adenylate cyclase